MRKFGPDPDLFCFVAPDTAHELGLSHLVAPTTNGKNDKDKDVTVPTTDALSAAEKAAQEAKVAKELDFNAPKTKTKKPSKQKKIKRPIKKNKK